MVESNAKMKSCGLRKNWNVEKNYFDIWNAKLLLYARRNGTKSKIRV